MKEIHIGSNPLIQSVVHKSLSQAIAEIGLPEFTKQEFTREIKPYLQTPGSVFEDSVDVHERIWKAMSRARVIVAEVWNDDVIVLYARAGIGGRYIDLRLSCRKHEWHIESFTLMEQHSRTIRSPWLLRGGMVAALLVAVITGYAVHPSTRTVVKTVALQTSSSSSTQGARDNEGTPPAKSKVSQPTPKTVTVSLSQGMSLYDFAKDLHAQKLVGDAMNFDMLMKNTGVDKDLKPGVYTFKTDMNENEIIDVLRGGPASS